MTNAILQAKHSKCKQIAIPGRPTCVYDGYIIHPFVPSTIKPPPPLLSLKWVHFAKNVDNPSPITTPNAGPHGLKLALNIKNNQWMSWNCDNCYGWMLHGLFGKFGYWGTSCLFLLLFFFVALPQVQVTIVLLLLHVGLHVFEDAVICFSAQVRIMWCQMSMYFSFQTICLESMSECMYGNGCSLLKKCDSDNTDLLRSASSEQAICTGVIQPLTKRLWFLKSS